jgi:hypothetical protein
MMYERLFDTPSRSELVPWFKSKTQQELDPYI